MARFGLGDKCFWHGLEPIPEIHHRVCGECWHVFVTAEELERAWNEEGYPALSADEIHSCPLCLHDW